MSLFSLVGLLVCFAAAVFVFALARASGARELAWERLRRDTNLTVVFAEGCE